MLSCLAWNDFIPTAFESLFCVTANLNFIVIVIISA